MEGFKPLAQLVERFSAFAATRWGRRALHVLRLGIPAALLIVLIVALERLGWSHVWQSRPRNLWFFVVLLLPYFIQPFADLAIYRNLLRVGRAVPLKVILRKRYLNSVMLDYSGEAYFFLWAKKNLNLPKGLLTHAVKDTNVLSAGAGLVMVWLMLVALVVGGAMKLPAVLSGQSPKLIAVATLPLILSAALVLGGRKVTMLSRMQIAVTFGIHIARCAATLFLDFLAWWLSGALPTAGACLMFVALRLLVSRLPLIPNKDLVFIGVGLAATGMMDVSSAKVAAVLVLMTATGIVQEFTVVGLPWLLERLQLPRILGQSAS